LSFRSEISARFASEEAIMSTATHEIAEKSTPEGVSQETGSNKGTSTFWSSKAHTNTVALVLMAVATLGSSWCGFQANLWNGIQTFLLGDSSKASRLASEWRVVGNQHRNLDAAFFMEFAAAMSGGDEKLARFLQERMRPEAQTAVNAWLATRPLQNPNAPTSPFVMPEYQLEDDRAASEQDALAAAKHDQAQKANMNSDTYTMLTVLFTVGLFLAGLINGFDESAKRWVVVSFSLLNILLAAGFLIRLPIAHRG
jgi:hypothetical protein